MRTDALIERLRLSDVHLSVHGARLRVDAPRGIVADGIRAELQSRKHEIIRLLSDRNGSGCADRSALQDRVGYFGATWLDGTALQRLPEPVRTLCRKQPGWTADRWAAYLRFRAGRFDDQHQEDADDFRTAARLLCERGLSRTIEERHGK